jgi:hypothetical protein
MINLQLQIIAEDYVNIFADQVHPMVQFLLPNGDNVFKDDNAPVHPAHIVQN